MVQYRSTSGSRNQYDQSNEQDKAAELMRQKASNKAGAKRRRKSNTGENNKTEQQKKDDDKPKMSKTALLFFLPIAVITDFFSLIPYVGLIVSGPFILIFFVYKIIVGLRWTTKIATTLLDLGAETLLSTLPGNTLDVILTYTISNKMEKLTKHIPKANKKISTAHLKK